MHVVAAQNLPMFFFSVPTFSNKMDSPKEEKKTADEVSGLDPRYECPVCLSCLKDTILTSCGHRFCNDCIYSWMDNKDNTCPIDGRKLDKASDLFPDNFTRREIMNQRIFCKDCSAEINLCELDEHVTVHSNATNAASGECLFKNVGCMVDVSREKMAEHLEFHMHHHIYLIYNAHMKLQKNMAVLDFRKSTETLAQESKLWEPSPKDKGRENHKDEFLHPDSLIRSLYERIIVLEQRGHEHDAQLQKYKNDLNKLESKVLDISLLHCFGHYLWHINHFSDKLTAMRSNKDRFIYSPGFYTAPTGYKVCGRINISPSREGQLALVIHFMKSPHDAALEWPFNGRITLAVIHPTDSSLTVKETVISRPDLESFQRPTSELNFKAFGYPSFISVNDITKKGFLNDDTLLVKIDIQCV